MFKFINNRKLTNMLLIFIAGILLLGAAKEYKRLTNLRVKGWLFGDSTWMGTRTWGTASAPDTLVIAGLETTDQVFITPWNATPKAPLYISSIVEDTVFVTSDSAQTTSTKYFYMVIKD